eukprot:CAMPEP_0118819932 /NCGR_PEP_ID=MMETSP1162-20130426/7327_1 /TAXON_ID=33656 /ORGANISM="Phaeocystis Sp, Strain CCMP2710" /LENGTH=140 /DNA_ID=CAMNT_0006750267 /DNA_START=341 /DNA_END=764 /DNA_ORIENTATION=-
MRYKCSSTVAVAKLSTAYLEEAKRNHHMRRPHLVPGAVLATPSARCSTSSARRSPTSHEQEPPRHLGLRKLNETTESVTGRALAGGAALTELHTAQACRVAKKEPMVVIARATLDKEGGGRSGQLQYGRHVAAAVITTRS